MQKTKEFLDLDRNMLIQCLLLYIGIWLGVLISNKILLLVALFTILISVFSRIENCYYHLLFCLPCTTIYKLSPTSTSLFVYVMLAVGIVLFFRTWEFRGGFLILTCLFSIYILFGMGSNYTTIIKMITGVLLMYTFVNKIHCSEFKNQIVAFSLGMVASSFIGMNIESMPQLAAYFMERDTLITNGELAARFTGLYYDPNYYSIGVITAVFLCLTLFFRKEGNRALLLTIIVILISFGFTTYSKMFLLAILMVMLIFTLQKLKKIKHIIWTLIFVLIICGAFYTWAQNSGYMEVMQERLTGDDISTGRFDIWEGYISYIFSSMKSLFFGIGLGGDYYMGKGPHNSYIEIIYFLGIIGTVIFAATIIFIIKSKRYNYKRKIMDYSLCLIFAVMYSTLGMLTMNDLMFYFMLLWMSLNINIEGADKV